MQDVAPAVKYFRYAPDEPPGVYQTPVGTFVAGQVFEASGALLADVERIIAAGSTVFQKANKKQFDDQDLDELARTLDQPYIGEEE